MEIIVFLSMLMMHWIPGAVAYDDLRATTCKAATITLEQIPATEVEWDGEISLQLLCEEGFDHPFNFNPDDRTDKIACKGKQNRWEPNFLPDCNKEITPKTGDKCPDGTAKVGTSKGQKCRGCPIGQYLDVKDQPVCKPCAKGYYQDTPMSTECTVCPYLKTVTSKTLWKQVNSVSKNRQFHVLGCPIVKTLSNGTQIVLASPDQFANEMREALKRRESSVQKISAKSGSCGKMLDKGMSLMIVVCMVVLIEGINIGVLGL